MSYKSILLDQLNACYNDKSWFIPLHEILIDLNTAQAAWETESKQSIWSIVNHLIFGMKNGLNDITPDNSNWTAR